MDGAIILNKPTGITSNTAVQKLRKLLEFKKIGHLGTLDPLATGVLPMLLGQATRFARFYLNHKREYVASIRFGWATTTYDRDGDVVGEQKQVELNADELENLMDSFRGSISQVPPPVSAKKVDGVRAYKLAHKNQPVELAPVEIEIQELELLEVSGNTARLRCLCSAGTYIRSIAHDLGARMGCMAHVAELHRTQVANFRIEEAYSLEALDELKEKGQLEAALLIPVQLLPDMPVHYVDESVAVLIGHGRDFKTASVENCDSQKIIKAVGPDGRLLCLGKAVSQQLFHPIVVLA